MIYLQNDTLCLPSGLSCYTYLTPDKCIPPCKGIFADRTWKDEEDLETNPDFQAVYEEYKNYKVRFKKYEGT